MKCIRYIEINDTIQAEIFTAMVSVYFNQEFQHIHRS